MDWFNAVDATYRADLRELNELNFTRFDAKLEQLLVQLDAKWEIRLSQLESRLEATLERRLGDHVRWVFVAWASLLIPIVGLWIRG